MSGDTSLRRSPARPRHVPPYGVRAIGAASLLSVLLTGCATTFGPAVNGAPTGTGGEPARETRTPDRPALTPDHFRSTATVSEDARRGVVTVSTEKGFAPRMSLRKAFSPRSVHADSYLEGTVSRVTGARAFVVYTKFVYSLTQHGYESVDYGSPSRTGPLTRTYWHGTVGQGSVVYHEHVAFELTEAELRAAAATYGGSGDDAWRFRLKRRSGAVFETALPVAELVGFLQAVDAARRGS